MKNVIFVIALFFSLSGACYALDQSGQFKDIRALEQADPSAAFAAMTSLAEGGYAPAIDRVGYYFQRGIGVQKNLVTARHWYARAVVADHLWSTASLARVEIKLNNGNAAFSVLAQGVLKNRPGTDRLLATAHIDRQLGVSSDPALGRRMLEHLSADGDVNAARDLVLRVNWGRLSGPVSDVVLQKVVQTGLDGDARFAEAALVYLSRLGKKSKEDIETRALLAKIPGISDRVLSLERVRLAAVQEPQRFWHKVEAVLSETETVDYARVAITAFWINKNSWVRVLQIELRELGHYGGKIDGRLTALTIKAQNRFCQDAGIWHICASGPLRGPTVRAVADAIASRKVH